MPTKLTTTISKIASIPNSVNSELVNDFYKYMTSNGASERHQNNNLKVMIAYAKFLGTDVSFYNIHRKEQIMAFLDTKIKNTEIDPDKKWITTWNHNLHMIKYFFRWLHNYGDKKEEERVEQSEWETPSFARIKEKRTKRLSPYSETELWERDEILSIVKYEPYLRNKAALTLFWDLDARNHEITLLKIKHIRLLERYGEGEIPHESKTGTGPILLTCSFPYVRDWLNKHPFKNTLDARLICNLHNGSPVRPEVMWTIMKQLRSRIIRMLENGSIAVAVDIRVTAIGTDLYAAEIDSKSGHSPLDWRFDHTVPFRPHTLDNITSTRLCALMRRLGLVYGAIDLRLTSEGEYVFLEVNPSGQYLFVERLTQMQLSEHMADSLAN